MRSGLKLLLVAVVTSFGTFWILCLISFEGGGFNDVQPMPAVRTTILEKRFNSSKGCGELHKWAILTTDSVKQVPPAAKELLKWSDDWCVLVLGVVAKQPTEDWSAGKTRLVYLSINDLYKLPFRSVGVDIPPSKSRRKNIGYLYAISQGAKIILDLDEHTVPIEADEEYFFVIEKKEMFLSPAISRKELLKSPMWSPHPYFEGQERYQRKWHRFLWGIKRPVVVECYPIIQHFLPESNALSNVLPYAGQPKRVAVPEGAFSTYNSQATFHLYDALWSLFLPKTGASKISDQLRSYIAQSLFYLIPDSCLVISTGGYMLNSTDSNDGIYSPYFPSSVALELVNMVNYRPLSIARFEEALVSLYWMMYKKGLVGFEDVKNVEDWIFDLNKIGYSFPVLPDRTRLWTRSVQLCIMFNWGSDEYAIRNILSYYLRFFDHITLLYDGDWPIYKERYIPGKVNVISVNTNHGWYQQKALRACLQQGASNATSFLYVPDDAFINISMMSNLPTTKIWFVRGSVHNFSDPASFLKENWWWWSKRKTRYFLTRFLTVLKNLPERWKRNLMVNVGFPHRVHGHAISDIVHIPKTVASELIDVLGYLTNVTELFCEMAIPLALDIVGSRDRVELNEGYLWDKDRLNKHLIEEFSRSRHFVHPLKISTQNGMNLWRAFMNRQLRMNH